MARREADDCSAAPYQLDMFRQSKNFDFAELLRIIPIQIPQWQLADLVRG